MEEFHPTDMRVRVVAPDPDKATGKYEGMYLYRKHDSDEEYVFFSGRYWHVHKDKTNTEYSEHFPIYRFSDYQRSASDKIFGFIGASASGIVLAIGILGIFAWLFLGYPLDDLPIFILIITVVAVSEKIFKS